MNILAPRLALAALFAIPVLSTAKSPILAPELEKLDPQGMVRVIVQFTGPPAAEDRLALNQIGAIPRDADLSLINGSVYYVPAHALASLAKHPHVRYVSPDRPVSPMLDYAAATLGANIAAIYGWTGSGVGVAIIDSGVQTENDLLSRNGRNSNRIVYSQSFVPGVSSTVDAFGHGTHVAGIVAGDGAASTGIQYFKTFRGIAPDANIINLRVLDGNGSGTDSSVIAAINAAIQLKSRYNIRVINLSLGRPVFESYTLDPLCQAVEKAWKAGIVVVVAAGNDGRDQSQGTDGYATITAPGNDPFVITVGAMKTMGTPTRSDDLIASYSSKGPTLLDHVVKPDVVAPGNQIISLEAARSTLLANSSTNLIPYSYYKFGMSSSLSPDYFKLSGTSMAAPMVSGAAAVMLSKDPTLSPDTIKLRLMKTATKNFPIFSTATDPVTGLTYTSQYDIFTIGAGYVDLAGALNSNDTVPCGGNAASPIAVYQAVTNTVSLVNSTLVSATHAVWGTAVSLSQTAIWGEAVFVNGDAALFGSSALWNQSGIWAATGTQGTATIWGMHAVWGTSATNAGEALATAVNGEN